MAHVLEAKQIELHFGGLQVLAGIDFHVDEGEIVAVIGPNGAGKTSFMNCINGFYRPQGGQILFKGKDITRLPPYKIAAYGISRTFQNIELYTGLSTLDNLMAARHILLKRGAFWNFIYFGPTRREEVKHREVVEDIIDLLELESIRKSIVGQLPYGQRKRVELGRALATEPQLLLLDEPMTGMNVEEKEDMARFILDIAELKKIPMVLVEHDMEVVSDISDRAVVLDFGRKIAEGSPDEVKKNPDVIRAYLGAEEE
ncbi:MAG: ABC transporter ATP-binding protein [Deltaproteobacteria bacterium]|nr:ABC transporter ATP-binding protein [Deltaproteobacteria bacterium]MBW1950772.1 ABC transporter ATP-binding protein [Deltaproteobacteria bacterium]MBW2349179.1 ABC transporter ATP-binding protein [Deltaproteobacteria bacterium]RLB36475.1 MAG: ABC transporter ATP-binding protein [Deltaproteobacteria bacterium]